MFPGIPPVVTVKRVELKELTDTGIGLVFQLEGEPSPSDVVIGFPSSQVRELHSLLTDVIEHWRRSAS